MFSHLQADCSATGGPPSVEECAAWFGDLWGRPGFLASVCDPTVAYYIHEWEAVAHWVLLLNIFVKDT